MKKIMGRLLGATLLLSAVPASAAVMLKTNAQGKLIGATGVTVGALTYNVDFADGSCTAVYGSCSADKFEFKTQQAALAAGNALLSQVLIGSYKTNPGSVFGCNTSSCDTYIPYKIYADYPNTAQAIVVANRGATNRSVSGDVYPDFNESTVLDPNVNYARFTLQAATVPELATWAMMVMGFGAVGATMRRRKSAASFV